MLKILSSRRRHVQHPPGWAIALLCVITAIVATVQAAAADQPAPPKSLSAPAMVSPPSAEAAAKWIDAWSVSFLPTLRNGALDPVPTFGSDSTVRFFVFSKLAGSQVRVKFTNKFQAVPLVIGAAHLALRPAPGNSTNARGLSGSEIAPETDRTLTFDGKPSVTLAPGDERWSDPVTLNVPQHADVAISVYLPETFKPTAFHPTGLKTAYIARLGNYCASAAMPRITDVGPEYTDMVFFISGLQVMAPGRTKVIVAFGDSITDGSASARDANASWPDMLSKRLPALPDGTPVAVINMGIGSNRLVASDQAGPAGVKRFADDVLARPNVTHLIVLEGINDISYEHVKPEQLIAAYQDVIARAHARGIKVFGGTLLPIQRSTKDTPENEATRQAVNQWIRTAKAFDAVIEFEHAVQDPQNPLIIRSDLTGDHVHPNTAGYKLMAEAIDLQLFQ